MLQLRRFPDIPVSTPEEARASGLLQRSSVSASKLEMRDPSLLPRERIPDVSTHLKRRRAAQERREELMGRATIPSAPRCLRPFQRILFSLHCFDFHAEERLTLRWHVVQTCGKPRGKASRDSHRSLDPREGKRESAASAREESSRACPHSRRRKTPLGRLEK